MGPGQAITLGPGQGITPTLGPEISGKKGTKTGFCLIDTTRMKRIAGSPPRPVYTQCGSLVKDSDQVTQGISVGWGDTYRSTLAEQWVDLGPADGTPHLANGDYAIRSTVDPGNRLNEGGGSREANNDGVTFFRVQGGRISVLR